MKIAHVIDYFQPKAGYQETFLALEQIKTGHAVRVFTSDRYRLFPDYRSAYEKFLGKRIVGCGKFRERGIDTIRLKPLFGISGRLWLRGLKKGLIEFDPDIVICHDERSFNAYRISKIKFPQGVKIIFDDHMGGSVEEIFRRRLLRYLYLAFFKKSIEASAYKIIGLTTSATEYLREKLFFDQEKIDFVPLGVDLDTFNFSLNQRNEIRSQCNIAASDLVGIYSGKINKNKGIAELIDALKDLFPKYPDFKFIFIGQGSSVLMKRIGSELPKSRITVKGLMSQKELSKYYCASDFGIWPDGITASHIEAAACGLAIIVSSLPAAKERIIQNNGISLSRCNKNEISKSVEVLLSNAELREKYSDNALEYAKGLSWKVINEKLLAL